MIINLMNIALILCLIACVGYIFWLHNKKTTKKPEKQKKKKAKKEESEEEEVDDEISMFKSNFDISLTSNDDGEQLLDNDS